MARVHPFVIFLDIGGKGIEASKERRMRLDVEAYKSNTVYFDYTILREEME